MGMPALFNQNGKVIAQIGGLVNKQTVERVITKDQYGTTTTTYYNYEWDFIGSYGIVALDEATGNKAWRSEKFDKRISNLILSETMVYAGSGDEFYGFDIASGEMKINVDHSKGKVGKTMWAFDIGENIALVCDNGMAAYSKKDGTKLYNTDKFRGVTTYHMVGNNFFLRKEKENSNTIAGVDLATGAIKGILKSKGKGGGSQYGDGMDLTSDGEYIFSFKGKGVDKYKVNK
ncbi:MAG: PQQ-binding-like beta-propeller repeat protein [Bacteroidetes bacterium]|nr:PQQ-binding-like beta-propeller repeat protein [Bacteroidota bacterium]